MTTYCLIFALTIVVLFVLPALGAAGGTAIARKRRRGQHTARRISRGGA